MVEVWFGTRFTPQPLTNEPRLLHFSGFFFQTFPFSSKLELVLSLASDSFWWGVLTTFVRSPKRLLEWPICRQGDDITLHLIPCPPNNHTSEKTISSSPLPLQTARYAPKVGGISTWSRQKCSSFLVFNVREYPGEFLAVLASHSPVARQTRRGQHLWVHSCTRGGVETAATELFNRESDGEPLSELWKQVAGVGGWLGERQPRVQELLTWPLKNAMLLYCLQVAARDV